VTGLKLKDQPAAERPRERLVTHGADALSHAELVAILLRTGLQGTNVLEVAKQLVHKYGSLRALAGTPSMNALSRYMNDDRVLVLVSMIPPKV